MKWCKAALESVKKEGNDKNFINSLKKLIQKGKIDHDDTYMKINLALPLFNIPKLKEKPFSPNLLTKEQEQKFSKFSKNMNGGYENMLTIDDTNFQRNDLPNRFELFLRRRTQELCRGSFER